MILGRNGSGKSSLLGELTPLPPLRSDYIIDGKGGSKEIHITDATGAYILKADFTSGSKFYFLKDGVELNKSNNVTSQRELCEQYFNITPVVDDIISTGSGFTNMSLVNRKKLFNSVTNLNIDNILSNYNKLNEELKEKEFLLKTYTARLLTERDKLLSVKSAEDTDKRMVVVKTTIDKLLEFRSSCKHLSNAADLDYSSSVFKQASERVNELLLANPLTFTTNSLEGLKKALLHEREQLLIHKETRKHIHVKMEELEYQRKAILLRKQHDITGVKQSILNITKDIQTLLLKLEILPPSSTVDLRNITNDLNMLERTLPDIVNHLPSNPDKALSKGKYDTCLEKKNVALTKLNTIIRETVSLQAELAELSKHKSLNCPNCQHTWLPEDVNRRLRELTSRNKELLTEQASLQELVNHVNKELEGLTSYLGLFSQLTALYTATKKHCEVLWKHINEKGYVYSDPRILLSLVNKALNDCHSLQRVKELEVRKAELEELHNKLNNTTTYNIIDIDNVNNRLLSINRDINNNEYNIKLMEGNIQLYNELTKLLGYKESAKLELQKSLMKVQVDNLTTMVEDCIRNLRVESTELEKTIFTQHSSLKTIKELEDNIKDLEEDKKVLSILTEELSPKTGYIAKSISSFLNVIISSINSVISSIWEYKMVVKPLDLEEDALNYKFKIEVGDGKLTVPDISAASSGMAEIINLAVKITMYRLLKLDSYPMKLDEFGVKLDEGHRNKIAEIVFRMMGGNEYSQIFLITHMDLGYANFKDTEVVMVD